MAPLVGGIPEAAFHFGAGPLTGVSHGLTTKNRHAATATARIASISVVLVFMASYLLRTSMTTIPATKTIAAQTIVTVNTFVWVPAFSTGTKGICDGPDAIISS